MNDLRDPTTKNRPSRGGEQQPTLDLAGGAVGLNAFEANSEYYAGRPSYLGANAVPSADYDAVLEAEQAAAPQQLFEHDGIHIAAAEAVPEQEPAAEEAYEEEYAAEDYAEYAYEEYAAAETAAPPSVLQRAEPRVAAQPTTQTESERRLSIQAAPGAKSSDWYRQREADRINPRRSLVIRTLRIVVPSLAAILLIGTLVWPLINADQNGLRRLGRGESAMLNARFEGYDDADRLVSITADQVVQATGEAQLIDLVQPLADLTYDDGSRVSIRANRGRFDEQRQQLLLQGDVNLFQPDGFEFTTSKLQVDTSQRAAWSDQPVTGSGPGGSIAGSAVQILENGRFLVFPGPGRLTLDQLASTGGG